MRRRLYDAGGREESDEVVRRLFGLVQKDLASGRRTFTDTMTVLKQIRAFITPPGRSARDAAEQRVRDWLRQYE